MRKAIIVAKQEIRVNVRRKGFILGVVGLPLLILASFFIPLLFIENLTLPEVFKAGVVDKAGILNQSEILVSKEEKAPLNVSKKMRVVFVKFDSRDDAERAFQDGEIDAYYVIPENFEETFTILRKSRGLVNADEVLEQTIARNYGDVAYRFAVGVSFEDIGKGGKELDFLAAMFLPLLLFVAIFSSSGYLMQGIVEEKENRVMEVLLSSASPDEVFAGKFIGSAVTGLMQASVWLALAGFASTILAFMKLISLSAILVSIVYFILGYLLYASILSAIASVSSTLKEAQQATSAIVFVGIFPALFLGQMISLNPDAQVFKAIALFPLTAPALMPSLYLSGSASIADVVAGMLLLLATSIIMLKLSAKVFRFYALTYTKPHWKEVLRSVIKVRGE
ncbi:ABC transporter permease [Geoglobus acetivorans]|uniref:ABC transporter permease n=1 Tax=Geoglobus acetivorans TaxID=565033 RepID=A0ABZ3H5J7_GEOAI|nr:ABC transporter permease [Geoglobus acetivorans]